MLIKFTLLFAMIVASTTAEAPLRSGPYPAAGWRPQRPFNLPGEYLPPTAERQQQQQPQAVEVEISKERVDFAGQIQSNALLTNQPQNAYIPPPNANNNNPNQDDFLRVQALPNQRRPQFLNKQILSRPAAPQFLHKQVLSRPAIPQRGDQPSFGERIQPRPLQQNFQPTQQQFFPQQQANPAQQYGAPGNDDIPETAQESDNNDGIDNLTAIEALNAAIDEYNRRIELRKNQENNDNDNANVQTEEGNGYNIEPPSNSGTGRYSQGQYYVLGPDNAIQRVMFTTTQDEEQVKTNGFTAQLKYTPVGEIRDPVFKYNERGQLVRILK